MFDLFHLKLYLFRILPQVMSWNAKDNEEEGEEKKEANN